MLRTENVDRAPSRVLPAPSPGTRATEFRLRVLEGFAAARDAWLEIEGAGDCYAFQTFEWLHAWQTTVGEQRGVRPLLVVVESARGAPWLLLPLGLERRHGGTRVLVWLGGKISDYHGPLIATACPSELLARDFAALWRALLASLPAFDCVHFERQREQIGARRNPFASLAAMPTASHSHETRLGADWSSYYGAKRSSRTRATNRRHERGLAEHGTVAFEVASESAQIDRVLEFLIAQKSRSWRALGVADLFACSAHRELVRRLAQGRGIAHLSFLTAGDRIVAAHWGLLHRDRFYFLLPTYDADLSRCSPGATLLRRLLERGCDQRLAVFDFTVGDEPYKNEWCERALPLYDTLLACTLRGRIYVRALRTRLSLKRRIKSSPRLWPLAQRLRARLLGSAARAHAQG